MFRYCLGLEPATLALAPSTTYKHTDPPSIGVCLNILYFSLDLRVGKSQGIDWVLNLQPWHHRLALHTSTLTLQVYRCMPKYPLF